MGQQQLKVGFVGAGNMARALARGLGDPVFCTDGGSNRAETLAAELGGEAVASNRELAQRCDLIILCHKPEQLHLVADEVSGVAKCVVSVLARTSYMQLQQAYPRTHLFRVLPNLAAEVRRGITVFASPPAGGDLGWRRIILDLFGRVGRVVELPESVTDVAGGVTGVGPAYLALFAEAWVDAAIRRGMPAPQAAAMVTETIAGSAELLRHRRNNTLALRREVGSPGGATARGLDQLEEHGLRTALARALDAVLDGDAQ